VTIIHFFHVHATQHNAMHVLLKYGVVACHLP